MVKRLNKNIGKVDVNQKVEYLETNNFIVNILNILLSKIELVYKIYEKAYSEENIEKINKNLNKLIKRVKKDIDTYGFGTDKIWDIMKGLGIYATNFTDFGLLGTINGISKEGGGIADCNEDNAEEFKLELTKGTFPFDAGQEIPVFIENPALDEISKSSVYYSGRDSVYSGNRSQNKCSGCCVHGPVYQNLEGEECDSMLGESFKENKFYDGERLSRSCITEKCMESEVASNQALSFSEGYISELKEENAQRCKVLQSYDDYSVKRYKMTSPVPLQLEDVKKEDDEPLSEEDLEAAKNLVFFFESKLKTFKYLEYKFYKPTEEDCKKHLRCLKCDTPANYNNVLRLMFRCHDKDRYVDSIKDKELINKVKLSEFASSSDEKKRGKYKKMGSKRRLLNEETDMTVPTKPIDCVQSFKCQVRGCVKSFSTAIDLEFHMELKHNKNEHLERPYVCRYKNCEKSYKNKNGLKYHINSAHINK